MNITKLFKQFLANSQSSGILLVFCVIISLIIANSPNAEALQNFLHYPLGDYSVEVWINDGLMAIFFLLVGLEIKREMLEGELSSFKNASLLLFLHYLIMERLLIKAGLSLWRQTLPSL